MQLLWYKLTFMRQETQELTIAGTPCTATLQYIDSTDRPRIRELYDAWRTLSDKLQDFDARGTNIPEALSESAFCLEYNAARVLKVQGPTSGSFDTLDLRSLRRQQIKATSVEGDLTSFGPKSVWDDLYWLDFYRDGNYDRRFDVYLIPNDLVYDFRINATQTFRDQQQQGRRPRLGIRRQIITAHNLRPLATHTI